MSKAMTWYHLSDAGMAFFGGADWADFNTNSDNPETSASYPALFPPTLRGLAYGDGFFTTIGIHQGQILGLAYHQARIRSHCEALHLYLSADAQSTLWQAATVFADDIEHGIIKIIVSRPAQSLRGYAYSDNLQHNQALVWMGVMPSAPLSTQYADFLTQAQSRDSQNKLTSQAIILQQSPITAICLSAQLASLPRPIAGLKSLNRLDGVMIAGELERLKQQYSKLGEGLVQDMSGNWVEGVMSNVFYQLRRDSERDCDCLDEQTLDKQWFTPPIESSGVRGTMRQAIMDKLETTEYPVILRRLRDEDLGNIKSLFFCNAVRGVIPVRELIVDNQRLGLSIEPYLVSD